MNGLLLATLLCIACSLCHGKIFQKQEKEEERMFTESIDSLAALDGENQTWVFPGHKPFVGTKAVLQFFKDLKKLGFDRYESTLIKEYDMGDYYLAIASYTVYSADNQELDKGTFLKFYKTVNGKTQLILGFCVSSLTPWPVKTP